MEVHWTANATNVKGRPCGTLRVIYLPRQDLVTGYGRHKQPAGTIDGNYMLTLNHLPIGCHRYPTVEAAASHAIEWGAADPERHYPVARS